MAGTTVLSWDDLEATPWRNGGGSTRGIASFPTGSTLADFDWRVSLAEVEADGPFSAFPGIDRVIMLVDGGGMDLDVDGATHRLGRFDTLAFDGDATTTCRLPAGPTRDLNLMTRRGRTRGSLRAVDVTGRYETGVDEEGDVTVLVALTTGLAVTPDSGLGLLDSVVRDRPGPLSVTGTGTLAEIRISPQQ
ncbi:HutD family protein [Streptomyces sp. PTM05]|uniref:HutD family protein n=1 Tax=Streptantibioticus parmotrematis TaxID=2873249 RepID=A0ABS7QTW6_9ACTN|nr:HutD family protein [Streptantibioticus parmotrematis]MBY8885272.1 HutD family protein [Streptantibioticus parmotrematis]